MKGYVIVQVSDISDHDAYAGYRDLAGKAVAAHGGRFIVRGGKAEKIEGEGAPGRVVVIEFPSVDAAKGWYSSAQYQEALAIRLAHSTGTLMIVEGAE
jgi:uncharacterized protein (DUF1330 family)